MSEYFRILTRLESERNEKVPAVNLRSGAAPAPRTELPGLQRPKLVPKPPPKLARDEGAPARGPLQEILEMMQTAAAPGSSSCVVLAPASGAEDALGLAAQVSVLANQRRFPVQAARVCGPSAPGISERVHTPILDLSLNVHDVSWRARLSEWRADQEGSNLLLVAPPLAQCTDAALLANVCDGLIIFVEVGVTSRQALRLGVQRTRATGCRILGLVVAGRRDLPSWATRLLRAVTTRS